MSATFQDILYTITEPGIGVITLNRPEKRNPIGPTTLTELSDAFEQAKRSGDVHAIILTGAGSVFSAGGDLSSLSAPNSADEDVVPVSLVSLLEQMHQLGKPIIAMVNGHALAGGLGLMVACDMVIASEKATFGTTEIKVGLWPMMITAELTRNIGRKKTLGLMLTGRRIDANEAESIGLINQSVPLDELVSVTMNLARRLAALSPTIIGMGLKAFYETQDMGFSEALYSLESRLAEVLGTADAREGIMAFLGKRPPVWSDA